MITILRDALVLLNDGERKRFYTLLALSALAAILQALAILSIMPFIVLLANPDLLATNGLLIRVYDLIGASSYSGFLIVFGVFGLVMLTIGNSFLAFEDWLSHRYICLLGHRMEKLVLRRMLAQPYEQHVQQHSARLSDVVLVQVERIVDGIIGSFMATFGNVALTAFIVLMLLVVSLQTTLVTFAALFVAYLGVFLLLRQRIAMHGEALTLMSGNVATHLREMLDGIREIKSRKAEDFFARRFEKSSLEISLLAVRHGVLSFLPNLILETLVFGGLVAVALYFMLTTDDAGVSLAYIALYGMAIYRLVPALRSIFDGISEMHHNADAIRIVTMQVGSAETDVPQQRIDAPVHSIDLKNISYSYATGGNRHLQDISLSVRVGASLCLFGTSGAGKTSLLNIVAGLLYPESGEVRSDKIVLGPEYRNSWRSHIGYCPQQVFLFDDTIASNIAFGVPAAEIDIGRVRAVAELVRIRQFVEDTLGNGFDTVIGEDGKTLSGGQQQRIGMARSLYHDPAILLLDESFSGLDTANRDAILDNLFALSGKTLLISTHDIDIAKRCDAIALIHEGRLVACDAYANIAMDIEKYAGRMPRS